MKRLVKKAIALEDLHIVDLKSGGNIVYAVGFFHDGYEGIQSSKLAPKLNMTANELANKFIEFGGKKDGNDVVFKIKNDAQIALEWCRSKISTMGG